MGRRRRAAHRAHRRGARDRARVRRPGGARPGAGAALHGDLGAVDAARAARRRCRAGGDRRAAGRPDAALLGGRLARHRPRRDERRGRRGALPGAPARDGRPLPPADVRHDPDVPGGLVGARPRGARGGRAARRRGPAHRHRRGRAGRAELLRDAARHDPRRAGPARRDGRGPRRRRAGVPGRRAAARAAGARARRERRCAGRAGAARRRGRTSSLTPIEPTTLATLATWAETAARLGAAEHAEPLLRWIDPCRREHIIQATATFGSAGRYAARLHALLGRLDEADERFTAATADLDALGARAFSARARAEHAQLLVRRDADGDRERARTLALAAAETARESGYARSGRSPTRCSPPSTAARSPSALEGALQGQTPGQGALTGV